MTDSNNTVDDQIQAIWELVSARASGRATNEQLEAAVDQLLVVHPAAAAVAAVAPSPKPRVVRKRPTIELDTEDYDTEEPSTAVKPKKRGRPRKHPVPTDWSIYEDIPLGKQGAQMMTTFGDGKHPNPEAVKTTLLGARKLLQVAVADARHVRRQRKAAYLSVKQAYQATKPKKPHEKSEWSTELQFRATTPHDTLAYDPKCGLDLEDLIVLFPEEINAYQRWNDLHAVFDEASHDDNDDDNKSTGENKDSAVIDSSGHLQERMAQFDVRTERMKDSWYLQFTDLRQGSFLPRRQGRKSQEDKDWDSQVETRGRGRPKEGAWAHMTSVAVRFLHWVGFDPQGGLPPPNDDTTHALAFLAYDFFGRIVEKAIFVKSLAMRKDLGQDVDHTDVLLELPDGVQLERVDIEKALVDPDLRSTPLFASTAEDGPKTGVQLYFGPGFEDRLELELEAMLASCQKRELSEEEQQILQEEAELFARIAAPPEEIGVASLLDGGDVSSLKPLSSKAPSKNKTGHDKKVAERG